MLWLVKMNLNLQYEDPLHLEGENDILLLVIMCYGFQFILNYTLCAHFVFLLIMVETKSMLFRVSHHLHSASPITGLRLLF